MKCVVGVVDCCKRLQHRDINKIGGCSSSVVDVVVFFFFFYTPFSRFFREFTQNLQHLQHNLCNPHESKADDVVGSHNATQHLQQTKDSKRK
jgi:hypothetical protein